MQVENDWISKTKDNFFSIKTFYKNKMCFFFINIVLVNKCKNKYKRRVCV